MLTHRLEIVALVAAFTLVATSSRSWAQEEAPPKTTPPAGANAPPAVPGAYEHEGFFLRAVLGPAGTYMRADAVDATISGGGGMFGLAIGGTIRPNLILYLEVIDDIAIDPDVQLGDMTGTISGVSVGVIGVGPGLVYYSPSNLYLSATLAVSKLSMQEDDAEVARTDTGLGVSLMLGKEWWIGTNFALGIAGQLFLGSMDEKDADYSWTASAVGIAVSATID